MSAREPFGYVFRIGKEPQRIHPADGKAFSRKEVEAYFPTSERVIHFRCFDTVGVALNGDQCSLLARTAQVSQSNAPGLPKNDFASDVARFNIFGDALIIPTSFLHPDVSDQADEGRDPDEKANP
jgi:hypothetical protein